MAEDALFRRNGLCLHLNREAYRSDFSRCAREFFLSTAFPLGPNCPFRLIEESLPPFHLRSSPFLFFFYLFWLKETHSPKQCLFFELSAFPFLPLFCCCAQLEFLYFLYGICVFADWETSTASFRPRCAGTLLATPNPPEPLTLFPCWETHFFRTLFPEEGFCLPLRVALFP